MVPFGTIVGGGPLRQCCFAAILDAAGRANMMTQQTDISTTSASRVAAALRKQILSGAVGSEDALPTTRDLSRRFRISKRTVTEVIQELKAQGLVFSGPRGRLMVRARHVARRRVLALVNHPSHLDAASAPTWYGQILTGADQALLKEGYESNRIMIPEGPQYDLSDYVRLVDRIAADGTAGVILLAGWESTGHLLPLLDQREIPWITIKPANGLTMHNFVAVDMFDACRTVGWLFHRAGRRKVVYMGWAMSDTSVDVFAGFQMGYLGAGGAFRDIDFLLCQGAAESLGYDMMRDYLAKGERPDAVLAGGDYLALGAIRACREAGLSVPEDIAFVGLTGYDVSAFSAPPLSVIHQPMTELGREAARLLLSCQRERKTRVMGVQLGAELILRRSFDVSDQLLRDFKTAPGSVGHTPVIRDVSVEISRR